MAIDLEDFILVKNGPGQTKKYRMTCNSCDTDRGYHRQREEHRECKECSIEVNIPDNVSKDDFVKSKANPNKRLYRMKCIRCEKDRGYLPLHAHKRLCKTCSSEEVHGVIPNTEYKVVREDSKRTRRRYKTACKACGKDTGFKKRFQVTKGSGLCKSCFGHSLKGRQFSEDSKIKMSESQKKRDRSHLTPTQHTEETRHKLSVAQKQYCATHGNQFVTGKSKGKHTGESICQMSVSNLGKTPKWKGRTFQYVGPKGRFKMRSSYELAYAEYMDSKKIEWEYEPKYILSNGKGFCPDFRLADGTIVEVKGFWTESAKAKWELFKSDNCQLRTQVIMKSDLLELGLEVE